ncbi:rhomboid family intramembrane serine protease [Aquibacillus halophilus]|uniref:Rhomboid family intramembrane serine protease n=1 Tax=Aquibacillus halophilus TaxID=930132 RepID=A0A6A8DC62_9BACI|nr:rhomboid family intramembrane serine protease [Aquibacillus halophilus]MRH43124.1 rhomboid family intramembrane serine protease [Aquibacillus halophilus]
MYIKERYLFFRLVNQLVSNHEFEILHTDKASNEVWLKKKISGTSNVIRIVHRGFDWSNQLKRDNSLVLNKVKKMKSFLIGRTIHIHNVYIATYPPVDQWESLKNRVQVENRNKVSMTVYYLASESVEKETDRLFQELGLLEKEITFPETELEMDQMTYYLETKLTSIYETELRESKELFTKGKPFVTYVFLIVNVLLFTLLEMIGSSTSLSTLIKFGAKYNPNIIEGEWWRIISSMFLHIGLLHLFMNMLALYYVGTAVERIYGNIRFIIIYFLAGIVGGIASFAFNPQIAAGASGAIFGLLGALLFFGVNYKKVFFQTMGWNLLFVIGLNIVFGLTVPQIDNSAHLGGLFGGFIASSIVFFPKKGKKIVQVSSTVVYLVIICFLVYFGLSNTSNHSSGAIQLQVSQELLQDEKYEEAILIITKGLKTSNEFKAELLYYQSIAFINTDNPVEAIKSLESAVKEKKNFSEAHYKLAQVYWQEGNLENAKENAKIAFELNPNDEGISELHQLLFSVEE